MVHRRGKIKPLNQCRETDLLRGHRMFHRAVPSSVRPERDPPGAVCGERSTRTRPVRQHSVSGVLTRSSCTWPTDISAFLSVPLLQLQKHRFGRSRRPNALS
jgi:hypothetical protein